MSTDESAALKGALQLTDLGSLVASVSEQAYTGLSAIIRTREGTTGDEQRYARPAGSIGPPLLTALNISRCADRLWAPLSQLHTQSR